MQQQTKEWKRADFEFHEQLGSGSFGVVYRAIEKQSGYTVAIKVIAKSKISSSSILHKRLQRQIQIHSRLFHATICRLYGYFSDVHHVYLVMQLCYNGSIYIPLKVHKQVFSDKKIASIFQKLATAVAYLSTRNVMHRDIKLQNILFDHDYNPKLTDFGCCVHTTNQRNTVCGTVQYLCPEMINQELYGADVDLYCLGIVLYELFFIKSPFYDQQEEEIYRNIKEGVIIFDRQVREIPDSAKDLIQSLLVPKNHRPTIAQVLQHTFILQYSN